MSDTIEDMINRLTERQRHEFSLASVRRVQHLMRDPRSVAALDTRERWLGGEATDEEMAAAGDAARAASWAASDGASAASAGASAAAWAAAWAASAASDARDAAWAAADASWATERAWQREELERMLKEGGGAC